jgi:uncharacterized protein (DUF1330 family)
MSAFVIGMYDIWDEGWREAYRDKTIALAEKHGGKILVRPNCPWRVLEGKAPCRTGVVMFEFPSTSAAPGLVRRSRVRTPEENPTVRGEPRFDSCGELTFVGLACCCN